MEVRDFGRSTKLGSGGAASQSDMTYVATRSTYFASLHGVSHFVELFLTGKCWRKSSLVCLFNISLRNDGDRWFSFASTNLNLWSCCTPWTHGTHGAYEQFTRSTRYERSIMGGRPWLDRMSDLSILSILLYIYILELIKEKLKGPSSGKHMIPLRQICWLV